jgi:hypothetical protein
MSVFVLRNIIVVAICYGGKWFMIYTLLSISRLESRPRHLRHPHSPGRVGGVAPAEKLLAMARLEILGQPLPQPQAPP